MTSPPKPPAGRVQVELPSGLEPVYVNFALITHSPSEIIVDCAQMMPQVMQAKIKTRLVLTPLNAKLLLRALGEHLGRFEAQHGEIKVPESSTLADQLFRGWSPDSPDQEKS
jgi:hypothetical protein